jgi:hypothetical protein
MPVCRCEAFGCARKGVIDPATNSPRGVSVDPRTFKSHQLQDRAAAARDASKRAISAHDADVVRYISSVTLADKVSGVPQHQGSRLWSKSNPDPQDLETLMQHLSLGSGESSDSTTTSPLNSEPSRRSRVDSHIRRLAGIEASVAELADRTSKELNDLSSHAGDPSELFPLQPLLTACASLRSRLDEVRGKQAAVVETKRSIAEQLDEVQGLLDKSKRDWKRTWTEYSAAATTPAANEVNTGELPTFPGILTLIFFYRSSFSPFPSGCGPRTSSFAFYGCCLPHCPERRSSRMPIYALNVAVHSPAGVDENTSQLVTSRAETHVRFSGRPSLSHSSISSGGQEYHLRCLPQSQMSSDIQTHL